MAEPSDGSIFEEREETMVSPTGGNPTLRTAHFIKPTVTSIDGPMLRFSLPALSSQPPKWPLKATFKGWVGPPSKWASWVDRMHSAYHSVWKDVGICEAILGSTYRIRTNNDVIFGIAERWCCETNTFIFPWGEATITLEDMMVLGGFSVLGGPFFMPLETKQTVEIEQKLSKARNEVVGGCRGGEASQARWMENFMGRGVEFEHEAFLCMWLSRFVFPGSSYPTIHKHVIPIAIHLARGTRVAIAPAVLANLYRDLSLLRSTLGDSDSLSSSITLSAPFWLAQTWAWERLPPLRPKPNPIKCGEPRLARWHALPGLNFDNVRLIIQSAGENFQWRPYATKLENWLFPKFYREKEGCESSHPHVDEELELFARCLRVSELVGEDCIQQYLPHRVAMQFGMDQEVPGWVPRPPVTREIAWFNYSSHIVDAKFYIPARLFESDVTIRYLEWWKQCMFGAEDAIKGNVKRRRRTRRKWRRLQEVSKGMGLCSVDDADTPPGFPPKLKWFERCEQSNYATGRTETDNGSAKDANELASFHSIMGNNEEEIGGAFTFGRRELELEARILKLERVVTMLKESRFGINC